MNKSTLAIVFTAFIASSAAAQQSGPQYFHSLADLSLYLKPRFNSPNTWDQQFGARARLVHDGNSSADFFFAYDPSYPIKFDAEPKWTTGIIFSYYFEKGAVPIAAYTAPKYNMYSTWKQEFGFIFRFLQTPRVFINSTLDYQATYPYVATSKPVFQAALTVGFPLGG